MAKIKSEKGESHRGEMTRRLIMIPLLLAERPRSQSELAAEFGVNGQTIRRDIDALTPHYQILDELDGRERMYRFGENYEYSAPNFTPAELATLLLAQQTIASTGLASFGTPFGDYGSALLAKVRSALPEKLRNYLDTLANIYGNAIIPAKDFRPHAETIDRLSKAAADNLRVQMQYTSLNSGKTARRDYDPYAVYFDPDGATLKTIGFDHDKQAIRTFSIDRIKSITITQQAFSRPADFSLRDHLTEYCFNGIHDEPIRVRLRAFEKTAEIFAERNFHPSQESIVPLHRSHDGTLSITIEMRVARGRGLERFIQSWLPHIEVVSPPELKETIAVTLRQSAERFSNSDSGSEA